jgi:type IV secretory pathway VirB2 component (pilin)
MAYDIDPDQSVSIVAIFLFIDAAFLGFPVLSTMLNGGAFPVVALVLVAGLIAAGVGLLQGRQWGWYLGVVVVGLSIVFTLVGLVPRGLFGLLIDALIIFLLTRPATRAKFGVR